MRRLAAEAAIRSALAGGVIALCVWLGMALACRITGGHVNGLHVTALWAIAAALFYLLRWRPTRRKLARRLDAAAGTKDRVSTMVEFASEHSCLHELQREDAIRCLGALSPSCVKIRIPAAAALACTALGALIAFVPMIPDSVFAQLPGAAQQESEEAAMLRGKIMELRAAVEESGLEAQDSERLLRQVDALLAQLDAGSMDIAALQSVREMIEKTSQAVVELTPRDTYVAAMLEFESLKPLGEAIFKKNMDVVTLVFDNIRYELSRKEDAEQVNALMDLVYDINASLSKPLRDNSQENLRQGMMMLAGGFETAAQMVLNRRDNSQMIETAIEGTQTYIREFLGVASDEERYDPYDEIRAQRAGKPAQISKVYTVGAAAAQEVVLSPSETEHVYDPPQGAGRSGYVPGGTDETGAVQRIPAPKDKKKDGTVPYGTVYGTYYAKYLQQAADGVIPKALEDALEAYFNGI
ncbi:MAG: hypothetical protein IKK34_10625 [Clostridia bacterium]|nr:hypothetical protein [Clostridia bacterium]